MEYFSSILISLMLICWSPPVNANRMPEFALCRIQTDGHTTLKGYNPNYQLCCKKTLVQRLKDQACCDDKYFYFTNEAICCAGRVSNRWEMTKSKANSESEVYEKFCCGDEPMLKQENLKCCAGTQIKLNDAQMVIKDYLGCCGLGVYDRRYRMCCGRTDLEKGKQGCCKNDTYIKTTHKCVANQKLRIEEQFCGREKYDATEHMCCNRKVIKNMPELIKEDREGSSKPSFWQNPDKSCCGKRAISSEEKCCDERLYGFPTHSIPNQSDFDCCGHGYYKIQTQICNEGKAVDLLPNQALCGSDFIDTSYQNCCANHIAFNSSSQECCEGQSYCIVEKGEACCNGHKVKVNEVCCENIKPCTKSKQDDNDCCFDYKNWDGKTFNKEKESCHEGHIMHIPKGNLPCGLNDHYNPEDQVCCDEKKYNKKDGQCCLGSFSEITTSEGSCCIEDGHVYRFDDMTNPCRVQCNKRETFDVSNELCCQGNKFSMTGHNYCCGSQAVDSVVQCCGGNFPYFQTKRKDCCQETQLYNPSISHCTDTGRVESTDCILKGLTYIERLCTASSVKYLDGLFQEACVRQYAAQGRLVRVTQSDMKLILKLRSVKVLPRDKQMNFQQWQPSRKMTLVIDMNSLPGFCPINHLKQLKRVIVLFDFPGDISGKQEVEISSSTPLVLSTRSVYRRRIVSETVNLSSCSPFYL